MKRIFIDGGAGTTGLRIADRLAERSDIKLLTLPEERRKDPQARRNMLNAADIAFLCLPDAASIEAVEMVENPETVIIDTSTAHRTAPGWVYGFPELPTGSRPAAGTGGFPVGGGSREAIANARRIAVPGCHAGGFLALVRPLVSCGLLPASAKLCCHSITGYSGGGKPMIAAYEAPDRSPLLAAPRQYALGQQHKHLKEMKAIAGLDHAPIFCPIVSDFYSGMAVTVPLFASQLANGAGIEDIRRVYADCYPGPIVTYRESTDDQGFLAAGAYSGKDSMAVSVYGNSERILLTALYDNLGKGASGAALECLNLVLGQDPAFGLNL